MPFYPGTTPPLLSVNARFSQADIDAIEAWWRQRSDQPNKSAAIPQLVLLALKEER